jgi:UDP-N-acetylglucosamine acyltransferase
MGSFVAANVVMGSNNTIGPYAVVGGDPQFLGFDKSLRSGVRIGSGNFFREYSTVHRSVYANADTIIGDNNYLMVSTHVAHDCVLGNNIVMVNFSGIAGHVVVEDRVFISSHVGVQQFCRIGRVAMVGGATGINRDVPPYTTIKGNFGFIAGLNIVGMRRAGVDAAARSALRKAYKTVFRSGLSLKSGIAGVRSQWAGADHVPEELMGFLAFLEAPSKRGFLSARSHDRRRDDPLPGEDE